MNREEIRDEKTSRLLNSAFQLFIEKGVENTTIQEIVDKANVGKGTFYFYFKDKYDIRDILISQKSQELFNNAFENMEKIHTNKLYNQLIFILDYIINDLIENQELLKFISKNLSFGIYKNAMNKICQHNEDVLLNLFTNSIREDGTKLKNPKLLLSIILELVGSTCYNSILYSNPLPIEKFKPYLYDNIKVLVENHNN